MSASAEADSLLKKHAALFTTKGPQCSIETSGRRALIEALLAKKVQFATVSRILRAEGIPVGAQALRRHAKRECQCH